MDSVFLGLEGSMPSSIAEGRQRIELSDRFIMAAIGLTNNGAPIRRNQAGISSRPADVGRMLSRISNIRHSAMWLNEWAVENKLTIICPKTDEQKTKRMV